jgi:hypothetical protein
MDVSENRGHDAAIELRKGERMSLFTFVKLMIGGWSTWCALIGFYALDESGKLLKIRRRIALWLEPTRDGMMPDRGLRGDAEDAAA